MGSREDIEARVGQLSPEQRAKLEQRLRGEGGAAQPAIGPRGDVEVSLTYCQQGIRLLLQVYGQHDGAFWNQYSCLRLTGPLDVAVLDRALTEIEERHEALRTTVREGWPGEQVVQAPQAVKVDVVDLAGHADVEVEAARRADAARCAPFDVNTGPVWRCHLFRLAPEDHVLLVVTDHLISDPWSQSLIVSELLTLYVAFVQGEPSPLSPALQYGDYAVWEREWLTGSELDRQRDYWVRQFDGLQPLQLPTKRPDERAWTTTGYTEPVIIDGELARAIRAVSHELQVTPAMTLLAAFDAVLAAEAEADEATLATFNLNRTRPEIEGTVGLFANMLVLRTDCSGDPSFAALVHRVRDTLLGALAHSDLPVDQLISIPGAMDAINRDRQDWIVYQFFNLPVSSVELPDLTLAPFALVSADPEQEHGTGPIDLHLRMSDTASGFGGGLSYNAEIFDRPWITALLSRFRLLLEAGAADPQRSVSSVLTSG
jgi:hypothetical protein